MGRRYLFAASEGGHLDELLRISTEWPVDDDSVWITPRHPQAVELLAGRHVLWVPVVASRDLVGTVRVARRAAAFLRRDRDFDEVVSTGSAVAVGVLPVARALGIPSRYIESFSRFTGPSVTGRVLQWVPGVRLETQHPQWASGRWRPGPSLLESLTNSLTVVAGAARGSTRVFVTLGTMPRHRFDALVDAVLATGWAGDDTIWQLGATGRTGLPGRVHTEMTPAQIEDAIRGSDVVVTHAGVGSILRVLDLGRCPVTLARRPRRGEIVDDHQEQLVAALVQRNLVVGATPETLSDGHLGLASRLRVTAA